MPVNPMMPQYPNEQPDPGRVVDRSAFLSQRSRKSEEGAAQSMNSQNLMAGLLRDSMQRAQELKLQERSQTFERSMEGVRNEHATDMAKLQAKLQNDLMAAADGRRVAQWQREAKAALFQSVAGALATGNIARAEQLLYKVYAEKVGAVDAATTVTAASAQRMSALQTHDAMSKVLEDGKRAEDAVKQTEDLSTAHANALFQSLKAEIGKTATESKPVSKTSFSGKWNDDYIMGAVKNAADHPKEPADRFRDAMQSNPLFKNMNGSPIAKGIDMLLREATGDKSGGAEFTAAQMTGTDKGGFGPYAGATAVATINKVNQLIQQDKDISPELKAQYGGILTQMGLKGMMSPPQLNLQAKIAAGQHAAALNTPDGSGAPINKEALRNVMQGASTVLYGDANGFDAAMKQAGITPTGASIFKARLGPVDQGPSVTGAPSSQPSGGTFEGAVGPGGALPPPSTDPTQKFRDTAQAQSQLEDEFNRTMTPFMEDYYNRAFMAQAVGLSKIIDGTGDFASIMGDYNTRIKRDFNPDKILDETSARIQAKNPTAMLHQNMAAQANPEQMNPGLNVNALAAAQQRPAQQTTNVNQTAQPPTVQPPPVQPVQPMQQPQGPPAPQGPVRPIDAMSGLTLPNAQLPQWQMQTGPYGGNQ